MKNKFVFVSKDNKYLIAKDLVVINQYFCETVELSLTIYFNNCFKFEDENEALDKIIFKHLKLNKKLYNKYKDQEYLNIIKTNIGNIKTNFYKKFECKEFNLLKNEQMIREIIE